MTNNHSNSGKEAVIQAAIEQINHAAGLTEQQKIKMIRNLQEMGDEKLNIMITGATGSGKSSTINALFDADVAKVGIGVDPETQDIKKFELKNMVLWDSPGLGDGKEADNRHAKNITAKLMERDKDGNAVIDLVLVVLDGSSRDLGTSYELINQVIIPNLGDDRKGRILVAINQCDMAMKGRYWNHQSNEPEPELVQFLNEKVDSVRRRIKEGTGVDVEPIYYSAGYKEGNAKQNPYNLAKLLYYIVTMTPVKKRLIYMDNVSKDKAMWKDNDDLKDYRKEIEKSWFETVVESASAGAELGGKIGSFFGSAGETVGKIIGGVAGAVCGVIDSLLSGW